MFPNAHILRSDCYNIMFTLHLLGLEKASEWLKMTPKSPPVVPTSEEGKSNENDAEIIRLQRDLKMLGVSTYNNQLFMII